MGTTAAGLLIETIHDWGVDVTSELPGDGTNGIMEVVDPFTPPMSSKGTLDQAAKFAEALARAEPSRTWIARIVLGDKGREPM